MFEEQLFMYFNST